MSRFIKLTHLDGGACYVDASLVGVVSTDPKYGGCISDRECRQLLWGVKESADEVMQKVMAAMAEPRFRQFSSPDPAYPYAIPSFPGPIPRVGDSWDTCTTQKETV